MKELVIAAEQSIKSRTIDLVALAESARNTACAERYSTNGRGTLDISFINDDQIARIVTYAVYDYFRKGVAAPAGVAVISLGFIPLFREMPEAFSRTYPEFEQTILNMERKSDRGHLQTVKNLVYQRTLREKYADDPFECDCWNFDDFTVSPDRCNPTTTHHLINFGPIKEKQNRHFLKTYIKYLIEETNESVNTILGKQQRLRAMLNSVDVPFEDWGTAEMEQLIRYLRSKRSKARYIGADMMVIEDFARYLVEHDMVPENVVLPYHELTLGNRYEFRETNRDAYLIAQIFGVLDKVRPSWAMLWFLLIFTTGMRKSEASAIQRDCLEAGENDMYYVRFYNQKMKKYVTNRIPSGLFSMLAERVQSLPAECKYMFPSPRKKGAPVQAASFCAMLNREFTRLGVRNADGTSYRFKAHDLRHWIAKRMYEEEIPVQFIQEQLHHESPEMTMAYVEFLNKSKAAKMKRFVDANGECIPTAAPVDGISEQEYAEYIQKNMNLRVLPNGLCARPKVLGHCASANSCLVCPEFRTEAKDLPKHREHLKRLDAFIASAEQYRWDEQAEESRNIREHLVRIINTLEETQEKDNETE